MLALISCSVPRLDEYDPYAPPATPTRQRRASRSLSFIKPPSSGAKKRRVSKMSIGVPEGFRHETHLGKDMVSHNNRLDLWDSARWQQELELHEKRHGQSPTPTSSIAPSSSASDAPAKPNTNKRNSITPQKRKPVPSIIPDMSTFPPIPQSPHEIPLPPSPTTAEPQPSKTLVPLLDAPRRGTSASADDDEKLYVTQTVKARWDNAMDEIEKALKDSEEHQQ